MSTRLSHSPSVIVANVLWQNRKTCSDPSLWATSINTGTQGSPWPVFYDTEASYPDEVVTVYNGPPQFDAKIMVTGEVQQHYRVTIRVRGQSQSSSFVQAELIRWDLNEGGATDQTITLNGQK